MSHFCLRWKLGEGARQRHRHLEAEQRLRRWYDHPRFGEKLIDPDVEWGCFPRFCFRHYFPPGAKPELQHEPAQCGEAKKGDCAESTSRGTADTTQRDKRIEPESNRKAETTPIRRT
jgi:hypothetical protein